MPDSIFPTLYIDCLLISDSDSETTYIHKEGVHIHYKVVLSTLSPNEKIFNAPVRVCQQALEKTGYNHQSKFQKNISRTQASTLSRRKILLVHHKVKMLKQKLAAIFST